MSVVEAPAPPKKGGLLARIGRALRDEVHVVRPRLVASAFLTAQLPQFAFPRLRTAVLRAAGLRIGARSVVLGPLVLTGSARIEELFSIGEQSQISGPLYADVGACLRIGDRVYLGHHVTLLTIDHEIGPHEQRCGSRCVGPIRIEDGVWIGSRVTVLPGITVGAGAVIAAGSLVNRDVPPDTLVAGVPARVVRHLDDDEPESARRSTLAPG
jgi:maltose O-acetyltransferase